ncbi:MAG TPA: helix-turn-helix domain-containing protein [Thermoleophilaceae bacterium]|nr:helix-turn-helix domain-containing protein [Thermoleophilaceae bacterium]
MSGRDERAQATRGALLRAARELFAERGYGAVGTEQVVARAGVTRGALYHHFRDKRDLFRALHVEMERELMEAIGERMGEANDPWDLLVTGLRAFLDACTDPAVIQINLLDAPSVLGWAEWREIDERFGLGLITAGLDNAMEAGIVRRREIRPLAHLLLASLVEAAMLIANAPDPKAAREEIEQPLLELLEGLRA